MNSSAYPPIDWARVDLLIDLALQEDLDTTGDVTTNSVVPEEAVARAVLLCKEPGMVIGRGSAWPNGCSKRWNRGWNSPL